MKKGFTLIELLVVMIVLISVGTIIGVILFSSLRGSDKINAITLVRQNGNFAISQMAKTIRTAKLFDGVRPVGGSTYSTNCTSVGVRYDSIKVLTPTGQQIIFACDTSTIRSNGVSLLDQSLVFLEPASSCFLTCIQDDLASPPTIGINFTLTAKSGILPEKSTSPITFSTSIIMRNAAR